MVAELPSTHVYASLQSSHHESLGMVKIQEDVSRVILVGKREQCWFYPKCTPAQKQWKNNLTDFSILSPVINLCQYFVFTKPCPFSVYNTHQAIKKALCLHNIFSIFFHCIGPWQRQHNSFHKILFSPFKSIFISAITFRLHSFLFPTKPLHTSIYLSTKSLMSKGHKQKLSKLGILHILTPALTTRQESWCFWYWFLLTILICCFISQHSASYTSNNLDPLIRSLCSLTFLPLRLSNRIYSWQFFITNFISLQLSPRMILSENEQPQLLQLEQNWKRCICNSIPKANWCLKASEKSSRTLFCCLLPWKER